MHPSPPPIPTPYTHPIPTHSLCGCVFWGGQSPIVHKVGGDYPRVHCCLLDKDGHGDKCLIHHGLISQGWHLGWPRHRTFIHVLTPRPSLPSPLRVCGQGYGERSTGRGRQYWEWTRRGWVGGSFLIFDIFLSREYFLSLRPSIYFLTSATWVWACAFYQWITTNLNWYHRRLAL